MDPYVIQIPRILRFVLVWLIIVPFRSKKSAANYQTVWTKQGSPLLLETEKAAQALQNKLGADYQVEVAMRYGRPSFKDCAEKLKGCDELLYFPQYPQYAESTVQTGLEHMTKYFPKDKVQTIEPYYRHPQFLEAYGLFLKEKLEAVDFDHVLMSFHGLPESHLQKTDPTGQHCTKKNNCCDRVPNHVLPKCYRAQCFQSAHGIAQEMGWDQSTYSVSFQSRLGRQKWIEPYTEDMYSTLVSKGVKNLLVICPGFSVDGLETLEEIAETGKETFLQAGGEKFHYIPCLNDHPAWIEACVEILREG